MSDPTRAPEEVSMKGFIVNVGAYVILGEIVVLPIIAILSLHRLGKRWWTITVFSLLGVVCFTVFGLKALGAPYFH